MSFTVDASVWVAAFDPTDRFHQGSVDFLRAVARRGERLHVPAFALLEVACAIARRATNSEVGEVARTDLSAHPALTVHPVDERLLTVASELGIEQRLRGADALYAGTAILSGSALIAWDAELVGRGGAQTPAGWLKDAGLAPEN